MIVPRSVQVSGHISPPPPSTQQHTRMHTALISTDLHSYPTTNYRSKRFISKSINLWTNCRDLSETWMRTILPTRTVHARSVLKYSSFKFALAKLSYLFRGQWQLNIMWTIYKHNKFCVAIFYINLSIPTHFFNCMEVNLNLFCWIIYLFIKAFIWYLTHNRLFLCGMIVNTVPY